MGLGDEMWKQGKCDRETKSEKGGNVIGRRKRELVEWKGLFASTQLQFANAPTPVTWELGTAAISNQHFGQNFKNFPKLDPSSSTTL